MAAIDWSDRFPIYWGKYTDLKNFTTKGHTFFILSFRIDAQYTSFTKWKIYRLCDIICPSYIFRSISISSLEYLGITNYEGYEFWYGVRPYCTGVRRFWGTKRTASHGYEFGTGYDEFLEYEVQGVRGTKGTVLQGYEKGYGVRRFFRVRGTMGTGYEGYESSYEHPWWYGPYHMDHAIWTMIVYTA